MSLNSLFLSSPASFMVTITILGLLVGSFLNVVIYRLPKMLDRQWRSDCQEWLSGPPAESDPKELPLNLITPGSHCLHCGHKITVLENIPLISYLVQRGRCSECHAAISLQYPIVEALTAVLSLAVASRFGYSWLTATALLFSWALLALSVIDLRTTLLPDIITVPFIWLGLLVNTTESFTDLPSSVLGAVFGYLTLWSVYHVFRLITGKEGMGYGDFKLLAMLGAWLGWQSLPLIVILSSFLGAAIGISLVLCKRHDKNIPIPFGPYLAGAGWIALLWGNQITETYISFVAG